MAVGFERSAIGHAANADADNRDAERFRLLGEQDGQPAPAGDQADRLLAGHYRSARPSCFLISRRSFHIFGSFSMLIMIRNCSAAGVAGAPSIFASAGTSL